MPLFPTELRYLWDAYHRLRNRKSSGFAGPNPVEWPDIDAFSRNTRIAFTPWEIEIIEAMDDAYMSVKRA